MKKDQRHHRGFSLIEMSIALSLGFGLLAYAKEPLMTTLRLNQLTKDLTVWQNMEDEVRLSVLDTNRFALAVAKNPNLEHCLKVDAQVCPRGKQKLKLFLSEEHQVTGSFAAAGVACTGDSCPVEVEATFTGVCRSGTSCEVVGAIEVDYRILVDGKLYKQGFVQRLNQAREVSDSNLSCPVDDLGRSAFASRIGNQSLSCLEPPRLNRRISGIQIGDCAQGTEVLAGFKSNGERICAVIKRKMP